MQKLNVILVHGSNLYRLLTKPLGIEGSLFAFGGSSKSCGLNIVAVYSPWSQVFQKDLLLCAFYSNI